VSLELRRNVRALLLTRAQRRAGSRFKGSDTGTNHRGARMAAVRNLTPRFILRRVGIVGLVIALIFGAIAVAAWALAAREGQKPAATGTLLAVVMGTLGLLVAAISVGAFTAASRFPAVAHLAGPHDFVTFVALTLAGLGTGALIVAGSLAGAILPLTAIYPILFLSSPVRTILRSPEVRAPGET
jgi:hypothetical protein